MRIETIAIALLENNTGQIEGVPKNPCLIKDAKYKALLKSIKDFPLMLEAREVVVYPLGGKYVVLGGNMRLLACKQLKHKEVLCKVFEADTDPYDLRQFAIKDNVRFGEWDHDIKANEWDIAECVEWGDDVPLWEGEADYAEKNKEIDMDAMESDMSIKLKYTEADYWSVKEALAKIASTPEQAVFKLLGL